MTRTGNHDSTPPPVITYPVILTSRTFDRTDCLDENFVISVAKTRLCNSCFNLRYYTIEADRRNLHVGCTSKGIVLLFEDSLFANIEMIL